MNYYRDKPNNSIVGNIYINYSINNWKSFDYKTIITRRLEGTDTERKC